MQKDLFRHEVRLARQNNWLGTIRLPAPRFGWLFFSIGLFALTSISALLICGHYTRHEQVEGTLVPSRGVLSVMTAAPGVVKGVLVKEGQNVQAGQPLLEISGEMSSATLGDTHAAIRTQLQVKRERLQTDLAEQQRLLTLQKQDLRSRLVNLHAQITQMGHRVELQRKRADGAMQIYKQWSRLSSTGVVSKLQILQQEDSSLASRAQLEELEGQAYQLNDQRQQLQGQLGQLSLQMSSKTNETERLLADVSQSLAQNAAQREVVLKSPVDGTVANLTAHPGQAVSSQEPLLTVLPANSELLAELWVPTKAIGFIHPGQSVVMRYQAFPYQKFGQHVGVIREVSGSAMSPADVNKQIGREVKEPRYRALVSLSSQSLFAYGQNVALRPGMTLDADILLERRRLIEWVAEPLYGFAHSADSKPLITEGAH